MAIAQPGAEPFQEPFHRVAIRSLAAEPWCHLDTSSSLQLAVREIDEADTPYSVNRYLIKVHTAEKPSRQVIFLPSEKLRPE